MSVLLPQITMDWSLIALLFATGFALTGLTFLIIVVYKVFLKPPPPNNFANAPPPQPTPQQTQPYNWGVNPGNVQKLGLGQGGDFGGSQPNGLMPMTPWGMQGGGLIPMGMTVVPTERPVFSPEPPVHHASRVSPAAPVPDSVAVPVPAVSNWSAGSTPAEVIKPEQVQFVVMEPTESKEGSIHNAPCFNPYANPQAKPKTFSAEELGEVRDLEPAQPTPIPEQKSAPAPLEVAYTPLSEPVQPPNPEQLPAQNPNQSPASAPPDTQKPVIPQPTPEHMESAAEPPVEQKAAIPPKSMSLPISQSETAPELVFTPEPRQTPAFPSAPAPVFVPEPELIHQSEPTPESNPHPIDAPQTVVEAVPVPDTDQAVTLKEENTLSEDSFVPEPVPMPVPLSELIRRLGMSEPELSPVNVRELAHKVIPKDTVEPEPEVDPELIPDEKPTVLEPPESQPFSPIWTPSQEPPEREAREPLRELVWEQNTEPVQTYEIPGSEPEIEPISELEPGTTQETALTPEQAPEIPEPESDPILEESSPEQQANPQQDPVSILDSDSPKWTAENPLTEETNLVPSGMTGQTPKEPPQIILEPIPITPPNNPPEQLPDIPPKETQSPGISQEPEQGSVQVPLPEPDPESEPNSEFEQIQDPDSEPEPTPVESLKEPSVRKEKFKRKGGRKGRGRGKKNRQTDAEGNPQEDDHREADEVPPENPEPTESAETLEAERPEDIDGESGEREDGNKKISKLEALLSKFPEKARNTALPVISGVLIAVFLLCTTLFFFLMKPAEEPVDEPLMVEIPQETPDAPVEADPPEEEPVIPEETVDYKMALIGEQESTSESGAGFEESFSGDDYYGATFYALSFAIQLDSSPGTEFQGIKVFDAETSEDLTDTSNSILHVYSGEIPSADYVSSHPVKSSPIISSLASDEIITCVFVSLEKRSLDSLKVMLIREDNEIWGGAEVEVNSELEDIDVNPAYPMGYSLLKLGDQYYVAEPGTGFGAVPDENKYVTRKIRSVSQPLTGTAPGVDSSLAALFDKVTGEKVDLPEGTEVYYKEVSSGFQGLVSIDIGVKMSGGSYEEAEAFMDTVLPGYDFEGQTLMF